MQNPDIVIAYDNDLIGTNTNGYYYVAEVQAESTAFVVSEVLGLDTSDYSFGYIAGWSNGKDLKELQQSLKMPFIN